MIQEEAEEEEQAPEKPALPRQSTALKDTTEQPSEESTDQTQDDDPAPGILRSDTIRPPRDVEEAEEDEDTVLEAASDEKEVEAPNEEKVDEKETQDQAPAEGDDAAKTVGD